MYGTPLLPLCSSRAAMVSGTPSALGAPTSRAHRIPACARRLALSRATWRSTLGGSSPRWIQWLPPCIVRWLWQSTIAGTIVAPPASTTSAPVMSAESFGRIQAIFPSSIARLIPVRSVADVPSARAASWRTRRDTARDGRCPRLMSRRGERYGCDLRMIRLPTRYMSRAAATTVVTTANGAPASAARTNLAGPVHDDLAALTRPHHVERFREILRREAVRDDRRDVEPALEHRAHAVPGLEHLAPVDPLQREAAEDHMIPADRDLLARDAEQGDAAAVVHELEHRAERLGGARHLEADVEALEHAELRHDLIERRGAVIDRERRAHAPREVQAVRVAVGDHDVARADHLAR